MIRRPSQLQLPEKRFLFQVWFPAAKLASLFGNLPAPQALSTSFLADYSLPELSRDPPLQPGSPPPLSLPCRLGFLGSCGWNTGQVGGGARSCPVPPRSASRRFLGPLPPRKLSLTLSRDVPRTAGVRDRRCQPRASGLVSWKSVVLSWGGGLGKEGAAHSFLPAQTRPSSPNRSPGPSYARLPFCPLPDLQLTPAIAPPGLGQPQTQARDARL